MIYIAPVVVSVGPAAELIRGGTDAANDCCTCGKQLLVVEWDD